VNAKVCCAIYTDLLIYVNVIDICVDVYYRCS